MGNREGGGTTAGARHDLHHSRARPALQYWRSVDHAVETFWNNFGPTIRAAEVVGSDGNHALRGDLAAVFARYDRSDGVSTVVENTYLLTAATVA